MYRFGVVALFVMGFYLFSRFVLPFLVKWAVPSNNRDVLTLFAFLMAMGSAWLAYKVNISPALGAAADYSGRKKAFLLATTASTVTATALLFFVRPGDVWVGVLIYVLATVGFEAGYIFYNAFLPEVSTPQTISRISGLSWADGLVELPDGAAHVRPGDPVRFLPYAGFGLG